jgi:phosphorylase kinase alpha/beta subunit
LVFFFEKIQYWRDEDSGHWEEARKIEASSIGAVLAGLRELRALLKQGGLASVEYEDRVVTFELVDSLAASGRQELETMLPSECVQTDDRKYRRYDAALLFLVYPLEIVDGPMARQIVADVAQHLQGEYGVKRYLGDSYWTADYKERVTAAMLTAEVSVTQEKRDALARSGEEAQWCIFDPIIAVIAGRWFEATQSPADFDLQTLHFNRSLGQLTAPNCLQGELLCPEAYYLSRGRYVPNDQTPLLWTIANLRLAFAQQKVTSSCYRSS